MKKDKLGKDLQDAIDDNLEEIGYGINDNICELGDNIYYKINGNR